MTEIETRAFGESTDGLPILEYTLRDGRGTSVRLIDLGATVRTFEMPDRAGQVADVVLGFDDVAGYLSDRNQYFGCTVGRCANRIARASFRIGDEDFPLAANDGRHHLHGGRIGFDRVVWRGAPFAGDGTGGVRFTHQSPDGDEGYPGNVTATVAYTLTAGELRLEYEAVTDRPTPVNLTNHSYFHLGGAGRGTILDHELEIAAVAYTPVDDELIPRGGTGPVAGTPLDFRTPRLVGERMGELVASPAGGYDHNFGLDPPRAASSRRGPPSPACSSTAVTSSPESKERWGSPTRGTVRFVWRRRSFPTRSTTPTFRP